ncbi:DUF1552 domain-containing protein [soil metagenome]
MTQHVSRRTVLRGLGTVVALPFLETLAKAAPAVTAGPPKRVAFMYVPNGVVIPDWTPGDVGKLGDKLPAILEPLAPFKNEMNVLSGLTLNTARANGDGAGDHARSMSSFLTGRQARKTHGADIRLGISADQHLANALGEATRFESIELGIERGQQAGNCDSGYSCAYSSNLSWRGESTPNAKETDPKQVFERLFGNGKANEKAEARAKRDLYNKSVLDFVMEDAKALNSSLGKSDQRKVDEYMVAVRELEERIEKMRKAALDHKPVAKPNMAMPGETPKEFTDHVRIMGDLMVLAFQTDLTRIVTFPIANDGSNRSYKSIEVNEGHHELSHHQNNAEKLAKIKKINTLHTQQLAYILGKMKAIKEANGTTLLDNSMIVYGSGIGDGNRHNHDELPILLLGKGGGTLQTGRHLKFPKETPLMNLYLAMFDRMGCPAERFGDSTGKLSI